MVLWDGKAMRSTHAKESKGIRSALIRSSNRGRTVLVKTTIDIPDGELEEAMRSLGAKSKREAVVTALREFNRRRRMAKLVEYSGTCDFDSNDAVEQLEHTEKRGSAS
jgi:Arc/MetJ family transcription regulator